MDILPYPMEIPHIPNIPTIISHKYIYIFSQWEG